MTKSQCPMHEEESNRSGCPIEKPGLNEFNYMPEVSNEKLADQKINLSKDRELSSIPKSKGKKDEVWEYPSPQQFYNALRRKGFEDDETLIDSMVNIHNFLNEGAWNEVLRWEALHQK